MNIESPQQAPSKLPQYFLGLGLGLILLALAGISEVIYAHDQTNYSFLQWVPLLLYVIEMIALIITLIIERVRSVGLAFFGLGLLTMALISPVLFLILEGVLYFHFNL